jgi:hypothetical protein
MLSVIMQGGVILHVAKLNFVMLGYAEPSVIIPSVVAPNVVPPGEQDGESSH